MITYPCGMEVFSSREDSESNEEDEKTCFFTAIDPMVATMLALQHKEDEPRNIHYLFQWRPAHHAVCWFDLRLAQNRGLEFWQTINSAIILYGSIPTHFLVKVVRRKLDDAEVEILCEKEQAGQSRVILKDDPAASWRRFSLRKERISMRLKPVIDERFDGYSTETDEHEQDRQALVSILVTRIVGSAR